MPEEIHAHSVEVGSVQAEPAAAEWSEREKGVVPVQPEAAEEQPESRTRGMLREAIQKVMEEIEYHEKEAKKHLQQAEDLRKDLRYSLRFLREQGDKGKPTENSGANRSGKMPEQSTDRQVQHFSAASRRPRANPKKRHAKARVKKA